MSHHDTNENESQIPASGLKEADDELDTEGQAFKWILVEDDKGKQRLRQTYEPDDPKDNRRASDTGGKQNTGR